MHYFLIFFLIFLPIKQSAAAPLMHAYLTDLFFDLFPIYQEEEKQAFRLGTLFPDIRYLKEISREETHFQKMDLEEILNEDSPFEAGRKFHSYVDLVRAQFLKESDVNIEYRGTFLKFLEDEVIYNKQSWYRWRTALKTTHPEEFEWGISKDTLYKWHFLLLHYFTFQPSNLLYSIEWTHYFFHPSALGIPLEEIKQWNKVLKTTAKNEQVVLYVESLINHFIQEMSGESP